MKNSKFIISACLVLLCFLTACPPPEPPVQLLDEYVPAEVMGVPVTDIYGEGEDKIPVICIVDRNSMNLYMDPDEESFLFYDLFEALIMPDGRWRLTDPQMSGIYRVWNLDEMGISNLTGLGIPTIHEELFIVRDGDCALRGRGVGFRRFDDETESVQFSWRAPETICKSEVGPGPIIVHWREMEVNTYTNQFATGNRPTLNTIPVELCIDSECN